MESFAEVYCLLLEMCLSKRDCVLAVMFLSLMISSSLSDYLENSVSGKETNVKSFLDDANHAPETMVLASEGGESRNHQSSSDFSMNSNNAEELKYKDMKDQYNAEWLVKLIPTPISTEWTLHNLFMESEEKKADNLAVELGMVNLGRVDPFPSVFRFRHDPSEAWKSGNAGVKQKRGDDEQKELDLLLAEHSSLLWASREKSLVRKKRTNYLQLNDPMFDKQWHLV